MRTTQFNKRWHSPNNAYKHLEEFKESVGLETIEKRPQHKRAREARIAMILSFVLTKIRNLPTFFRLPLNDPPDAYLMQPNNGTMDITTVELTSYRKSKETLLDQLIRTKKIGTKYSSEYLMLVHLFTEEGVDYQAISDYANAKNVSYPIWTLRETQSHPDTIAEVVIINPTISKFEINVGEEAFHFKQKYNVPHVLFTKQAASPEEVRSESYDQECLVTPWENLED